MSSKAALRAAERIRDEATSGVIGHLAVDWDKARAIIDAEFADVREALEALRDTWDMPDDTQAQRRLRAVAWKASEAALAKVRP